MSNRSGSPYSVPRDANHVPFLVAASTSDGITPVVLEADPVTHVLQTSGSGGSGGSTVFVTNNVYNAQVTMTGSAIQLATNTLSQGITIEALSTNTASVYVGNSSVSTSNGLELPPGSALVFPASNSNLMYVIGTSGDKVSWIAG